jgi:Cu(I)/Ag(I) efflux system membrane protein CusA/SilA
VDAAIVVTENAFRFIENRRVDLRDRAAVAATVLDATRLVGRPILFSMAIIILAFVPVFALTGQEGKLFRPLAFTKTFAMAGATILSVTLVPVLCSLLIGGKVRGEDRNPIMRPLVWLYRPLLGWALSHRVLTLGAAVLVLAGAVMLVPRIGKEFMPPLNEGDLMFMPITDPAISLPQAIEISRKQNAAIQSVPEVAAVVAKIARAETSTDPAPDQHERDRREPQAREPVASGHDAREDHRELDVATTRRASRTSGPTDHQPINMLTTGIRSEVGVKVFGDDLKVLEERAARRRRRARKIPGAGRRVPGAGHGRALRRHSREPRGRRPVRITVGAIRT